MSSVLNHSQQTGELSELVTDAPKTDFKLKGNMGTFDLLFTVLAFSAPLGVVFGFLSYNISFGIGVPIAFLGATVLMMMFALGFTNMTRRVPRPGAFYTYITEGLGKKIGLGASFLALITYSFNIVSAIVLAGIAVNNFLASFSIDSGTPWWVWSILMLTVVWIMSYFNVEFSAKLLSRLLVLEIIAIIIFDTVVLFNGGPEGHTFVPWTPTSLIEPKVGLLLLFCVGLFNGFEATAIYRDEVRDPVNTIPRATYLAILFLGIFYAISSYTLIISAGASNAVANAQANPAGMMPEAILKYFGAMANQIVSVLLLTSMFAGSLSLQNILSRYTHSLSVDGVFPRALATVHPKHGSPYVSAVVVGGVILAAILILVLTGTKETALYGAAGGIAFYGMLLLLFLTSVAVLIFFRRKDQAGGFWKTFVAPLIAAIGIGAVLVTATRNIELLIDAPPAVLWSLVAMTYAAIGFGIVLAFVLKVRGSPIYERIGRRVD